MKWSVSELLVARDLLSDLFLYWLVVIMIDDTIRKGTKYQPTPPQIQMTTHTAQKTQGSCPTEVSDIDVKGQW